MKKESIQEKIWKSDFGREYTKRNTFNSYETWNRSYIKKFGVSKDYINKEFLQKLPKEIKILEIGCNIGYQLNCLKKMGFKDLNAISNWRRKLDDSYETPFIVDGLRWNTVSHYFLGSQFKKGFPDFYKEFSLDSNSEFSTNLIKARAAGSENGKLKDKLFVSYFF